MAGADGAGKTTFAINFLPDFVRCREFLNADLIAAGLSPFAPETQNVRAGRLLLARIRELTEAAQDFGFETTLAGRGFARQFREMKSRGYRIGLFFPLAAECRLRRGTRGQSRPPGRPCRSGRGHPSAIHLRRQKSVRIIPAAGRRLVVVRRLATSANPHCQPGDRRTACLGHHLI